MMKYIGIIFSSFLFIQAGAQNSKFYTRDSASISKAKRNTVELVAVDTIANASPAPFNSFIVKDVRFDTTSIGVKIKTVRFTHDKTYEKTVLQKGTTASLTNYFNNGCGQHFTSGNCTLALFVKELRITQVDSFNRATNNMDLFQRVSFEAEAYLVKDNRYYPAARLDTMAVSVTFYKNSLPVLTDVLNVFAVKCAGVDTAKIFKRKAYTAQELYDRYNSRFAKPILHAQQLQAGVYKTFSEFINNDPSEKQYEIRKDRKAAVLYTRTGNNDWAPARKAFGFCNGKLIWINVNDVFHLLVRQGNTFQFLADYYPETMRIRRSGRFIGNTSMETLGGSLLLSGANSLIDDSPGGKIVYQLNMEDGGY